MAEISLRSPSSRTKPSLKLRLDWFSRPLVLLYLLSGWLPSGRHSLCSLIPAVVRVVRSTRVTATLRGRGLVQRAYRRVAAAVHAVPWLSEGSYGLLLGQGNWGFIMCLRTALQQSLMVQHESRSPRMPSSCLGLRNGPCLELFGRGSNFSSAGRVRAIGWLRASHSTCAGSCHFRHPGSGPGCGVVINALDRKSVV